MESRDRPSRASAATLALSAALLLVACGSRQPGESPLEVDVDQEAVADVPVCLEGEPFVTDGAIEVRDAGPGDAGPGDAGPGDAGQIGDLRWQRHEGCERWVIDLLDDQGAPADRVGRVTAEVLRELGVVRIELRDVSPGHQDITDATFDGALSLGAFVVSAPDGQWMYVDIHLAEAAEAHVTALEAPARLVVDLRPGGPAVPEPAPRERQIVVLEPRPGFASYPMRVAGYSRTFEANVVYWLEQDGQEVGTDFTTATGWVDAWGHYTFTVEEGPRGDVVLHVGEHSAKDGSWQGVAVELQIQ